MIRHSEPDCSDSSNTFIQLVLAWNLGVESCIRNIHEILRITSERRNISISKPPPLLSRGGGWGRCGSEILNSHVILIYMFRILFGIAMIVGGFFISYKYEKVYGMMGKFDWAERNLGPGRTRLWYQVLGFVIAIMGGAVMFDLHTKVIIGILGPLFGSL